MQSARGAISRAKAFTRKNLWAYADPGTVQVVVVPDLPPADRIGERVTLAALQAHQTPTALDQVRQTLDDRRPLGTMCLVDWAKYKTVQVQASIVVRRRVRSPDPAGWILGIPGPDANAIGSFGEWKWIG